MRIAGTSPKKPADSVYTLTLRGLTIKAEERRGRQKMRDLLCAAGRERNFGGIGKAKAASEVTTFDYLWNIQDFGAKNKICLHFLFAYIRIFLYLCRKIWRKQKNKQI